MDGLKSLLEFLEILFEEFDKVKEVFKIGYWFLFNDIDFEYDVFNKILWIKGSDYKICLLVVFSGYQFVLFFFLIIRFLFDLVLDNVNKEDLSIKEKKQIEKEVNKVMNDKLFMDGVKFVMLCNILFWFKYFCFVNIVEEMELNFYLELQ